MTLGDTDIKRPNGGVLEVISKAAHEGVTLRTWGANATTEARLDFTADEALELAQALILAATTSIRFRAGLPKVG